MEAKDSFTLSWCGTHKNWWVTNCPDCMVDFNEQAIKQEARREVVEWIDIDYLITAIGRGMHNMKHKKAKSQAREQMKRLNQLKEWRL